MGQVGARSSPTPRPGRRICCPGLGNTLKAAALAMVIALPLGALFGIAPALRPPLGAGAGRRRGGVLPGHPGPAADAVRERSSTSEFTRHRQRRPPAVRGRHRSGALQRLGARRDRPGRHPRRCPRGRPTPRKAIGMRKGQTMTHVLLPQAVTAMLPAIVSQLVVIVKDTALGGAMLGFTELLSSRRHDGGELRRNIIAELHRRRADLHRAELRSSPRFACWLEGRLRRGKKSTGAVLGAGRRWSGLDAVGTAPPASRAAGARSDGPSTRVTRCGRRRSGVHRHCPRHLTQAPAMGCIRSVIVHPAPPACSPLRPSGHRSGQGAPRRGPGDHRRRGARRAHARPRAGRVRSVPSVVLDEGPGKDEPRLARTVVLREDTAALVERLGWTALADDGRRAGPDGGRCGASRWCAQVAARRARARPRSRCTSPSTP